MALVVGVIVAAAFMLPAFAQRLRSPSSSLVLGSPTVSCGASPKVNLAWTDSASSPTGSYSVMSKLDSAKQTSWSNGSALGNVTSTQVSVSNNTTWDFAIHAITSVTRDSNVVSVAINCAPVDGTAPGVPAMTSATPASCSEVDAAWTAVTDTGGSGLAGYNVYRNGAFVHRVNAPATTYADTVLAASTTYSYQVSAIDNAGNQSPKSAALNATTPACPSQQFTANAGPDQSASVNQTVTLVGSAVDTYASITNWSWRFGDGSSNSGGGYTTAQHSYAAAGTYTVTLTVSDARGATATDAAIVTVGGGANHPPVANAGADQSVQTLVAVSFNASGSSDSDGSIVAYAWTFGDGAAASGVNTSHSYASSGTYTVTLTVTDNQGAAASDNAVVTVTNRPPVANAGADQSGTVGSSVMFNGSGSADVDGTITNYAWTFGDGASGSGASVAHVYSAAGTYTVTLTVTDDKGATASDTAVVTVNAIPNQPPLANAGADQTAATLAQLSFSGALSSDPDGSIATYAWSFGDGATSTGVNVSHSYVSAGVYTVTLTVTDNQGATASDALIATITNRPPTANAGADQTTTVGTAVSFNGAASSDVDGTITNYAWTFGDGASGSGVAPSHTYSSAGSYTATLTVTDNKGATASDSAVVTVNAVAATVWSQRWGGTDSDIGEAVASDGAGTMYVVGETYVSGVGQAFVNAYAPSGAVLWTKSFGGTGEVAAAGVAVDGSGNLTIVGHFAGTVSFGGPSLVASGIDGFIVQLGASNGAHHWSKSFGSTNTDMANAVAVDGSGNVYVTGFFEGTANFGGATLTSPYGTDLDVFVAKYSSAGAHAWSKNFPNTGNDEGTAIAVDSGGNIALAGFFTNGINFTGGAVQALVPPTLFARNGVSDGFVARFDTNGNHIWSRQIGTANSEDQARGVAVDASGNVVVAGYVMGATDFGGGSVAIVGNANGYVAKYSAATGAYSWAKLFTGANTDSYGDAVTVDGAGNVLVSGSFTVTTDFGGATLSAVGSRDGFVAKYNGGGTIAWARGFGGSGNDQLSGVADSAGNPVAIGYFYASGNFGGTTLTSAGASDVVVTRMNP
jgi:PKD repeat protein